MQSGQPLRLVVDHKAVEVFPFRFNPAGVNLDGCQPWWPAVIVRSRVGVQTRRLKHAAHHLHLKAANLCFKGLGRVQRAMGEARRIVAHQNS